MCICICLLSGWKRSSLPTRLLIQPGKVTCNHLHLKSVYLTMPYRGIPNYFRRCRPISRRVHFCLLYRFPGFLLSLTCFPQSCPRSEIHFRRPTRINAFAGKQPVCLCCVGQQDGSTGSEKASNIERWLGLYQTGWWALLVCLLIFFPFAFSYTLTVTTDSETSAKISLNVEQAFTSLIRSILKARALDTATRRPGHTSHSFNPNVAIVEERLAQQESKSRQSVTVDEKRPAPRKKNPNLAMDRSRSKSIGGLGEKEKSGSCCVIS